MAPAVQNDDNAEMPPQVTKRLKKLDKLKLTFENNNTVIMNSDSDFKSDNNVITDNHISDSNVKSDIDKSDIFDLSKYEAMEFVAQWRWPDTIVQMLLHGTSLYAVYLILTLQVKFLTIFFAFMTIYTSGFGITAGVHRLWSHRAYKAKLPLRVLLAVLFTITGQRDIYTWALDHRVHHKYSETVADPHNINRGFWFAHVGWVVLTPHPAVEDRRAALRKTSLDLLADPVVILQQKYFIPMFAVLNVALPTLIPWYLGDTLLNCFLVSFVLRFTITLNIAFSVNSFAHLWGNQPYDRFVRSVENSMVSLAALGEGWHNYHHVFPWDYRTSELGKLNISTTFIHVCQRIGWAYDLKSASPSMIVERAERSGDGTLGHTEEPHPEDT